MRPTRRRTGTANRQTRFSSWSCPLADEQQGAQVRSHEARRQGGLPVEGDRHVERPVAARGSRTPQPPAAGRSDALTGAPVSSATTSAAAAASRPVQASDQANGFGSWISWNAWASVVVNTVPARMPTCRRAVCVSRTASPANCMSVTSTSRASSPPVEGIAHAPSTSPPRATGADVATTPVRRFEAVSVAAVASARHRHRSVSSACSSTLHARASRGERRFSAAAGQTAGNRPNRRHARTKVRTGQHPSTFFFIHRLALKLNALP